MVINPAHTVTIDISLIQRIAKTVQEKTQNSRYDLRSGDTVCGYRIMGKGADKVVFDLGNGMVLKVQLVHTGYKGNQVAHEVKTWLNSTPEVREWLAPIYAWDMDNYTWSVMEKAEKTLGWPDNLFQIMDDIAARVGYIVEDLGGENIGVFPDGYKVIDYGFDPATPGRF